MQEIKPVVAGSRGGYGWAQWTADRRRAFEAWAKRKGWSVDSYDANYSFLIRELLGPEKRAIAAVKNAQGLDAKVKAFEASYERAGVKAYSKRISWAKKALAAYHAAALALPSAPASPSPVSRPNPAPPPPVESAALLPGSWIARALMRLRIVRQPVNQQALKTDATGPDEMVRRVQQQLQALGYPEVGLADGYRGAKTQAAIRAFAADNGIGSNGDITDKILATLPKARPRPVTEHRAITTARDLRAAGNEQAKAFKGLGWLGQALGLGGLLGAVNELGALDSIREAADGAATTFATFQGLLVAIVSTLQWCVAHWWLFAMLAGLWTIYRVTVAVLNLVILFGQGVLQRASAIVPNGGWHPNR
jgi:peptidoglycan hydrolase-like protein with peptidoglycan-binding domain